MDIDKIKAIALILIVCTISIILLGYVLYMVIKGDEVMSEEKYVEMLEDGTLYDYITNLQDEYEKEYYLVDKLTRQLNDEYKNTEYQCKQKEDYKSKCEKAIEYIDKYLEREYFDTDILENNTIYNRDLFKVKQILDKENK